MNIPNPNWRTVDEAISELSKELAVKTSKATKEQISTLILQIIESEDIVREVTDMPCEMKDQTLIFTVGQRLLYRPYIKYQELKAENLKLQAEIKRYNLPAYNVTIVE